MPKRCEMTIRQGGYFLFSIPIEIGAFVIWLEFVFVTCYNHVIRYALLNDIQAHFFAYGSEIKPPFVLYSQIWKVHRYSL